MNKLVDQYNNTYRQSIGKKPINADYSALDKKIEISPKTFKLKDRHIIMKYKNIFSNSCYQFYVKISLIKYFDDI